MNSWKPVLHVPGMPLEPRPDRVLHSEAPDGDLYAAWWRGEEGGMGDNPGGTVQVQFHPHQDPDADPPESRLASWEEVVSALAHVAPRGAAFTIPPIVALDPDDLEPMYGRTAFLLVQVGWAQPLHSDIIIPKGPELIQ